MIPFQTAPPPDVIHKAPLQPNQRLLRVGSPGTDSTVRRIDLNDALIRHPEATFFRRASADAMHEAGIDNGDVLLVDRAHTPSPGNVVIADLDGERICCRLWKQGDSIKL